MTEENNRKKRSEIKSNKILNCTGLFCPQPVFKTRIELDKMIIGEILEVHVDDKESIDNIKDLVNRLDQEILKIQLKVNYNVILIKKKH